MGRAPCCAKVGLHRGPWTPREDTLLSHYIQAHGEGHWRSLPKKAGLLRCGKSCRLRWMNYLRPDIKRGNITPDEDDLIIRLHSLLGNRWSLIAGRLPGRTDNEIKNYWNTHLSKRFRAQRAGSDTAGPYKRRNTNNKATTTTTGTATRKKNKKTTTTTTSSATRNTTNNDNNIEADENTNVIAKQKVHLPKPVRVRRNYSFEGINKCGSSGQEKGSSLNCNNISINDQEVDVPWSLLSARNLDQPHDHDQDQGHHDLGCKENNNNNGSGSTALEKIYEEYLAQLLKTDQGDDHDQVELDSFAESLLLI